MGFGSLFKKDKNARQELVNKGVKLLASGNIAKAIECFHKALELLPEFADVTEGPTAAEIWNIKGMAFGMLENTEEGMKCCDKAIELSSNVPFFTAPWINKSRMLVMLGNTEEAIKCLDKVIKMTDKYPECRYEPDIFDNGTGTADSQALAWYNKGFIFPDGSEKAMKCFDKAIKSDPGFVDAWINKGYSLHHLGKHEESVVCIRKALELAPNHEYALSTIKTFGYEEYFK